MAGMPVGRPSKMTRIRADEFVRLIDTGVSIDDAAAAVGVTPRTVRHWRQRAWSARAADLPFIAFEKAVQRALGRRELAGNVAGVENWESVAMLLEREFPERWAAPPVE